MIPFESLLEQQALAFLITMCRWFRRRAAVAGENTDIDAMDLGPWPSVPESVKVKKVGPELERPIHARSVPGAI